MNRQKNLLSRVAFIISLLVFFFQTNIYCQIQYGGEPLIRYIDFSEKGQKDSEIMESVKLTEEKTKLREEILTEKTPSGQAMRGGFSINVNYSPKTHGNWVNIGDSINVWRLIIQTEKANGIGLVLEDFEISDNSKFFIYDKEGKNYIGAFTSQNNNNNRVFSAQPIPGETLVFEYQERINENYSGKFEESSFKIKEIIYQVKGAISEMADEKNLGSSGWCMININCSEGDDWQRHKRGITRLFMRMGGNWYWCSGSLVNTTLNDGTPYLLTADHCGANASSADLNVWQFYFNFERPGCSNVGLPPNNVLFGSTLIASSPIHGGSDYKVLMLDRKPPIAWRPYYNGWSSLNVTPQSGVGIHHPAGDAKKISTYDGDVSTGTGSFNTGAVMAENSAWVFRFIETENGHSVTEGGSSGSPMFNEEGLIVGTLSGGSSSCSSPEGINVYGKMSYHWDESDVHPWLKFVLDPLNTGENKIGGYDPHIEDFPPPGFVAATKGAGNQASVKWYRPGEAPNKEGWHSYTTKYVGQTSQGPRRATVFNDAAFDFSYPVKISQLSHVFKKGGSSWTNDEFTFQIFDSNGTDMLYESPTITAESLTEVKHNIFPPLTLEDKFYVVVNTNHPSGHPSSAYDIKNFGNSYSYYGSPPNWVAAGSSSNQFVYLTSIFVDDSYKENNEKESKKNEYNYNEADQKWEYEMPFAYRVYKNDEHIHTRGAKKQVTYTYVDEIEGQDGNIIKYHVTALYDDGNIESSPSNVSYIILSDDCGTQISDFPYKEVFDDSLMPDCWETEGLLAPSWELTNIYEFDDNIVEPVEGSNFVYVEPNEEKQDEWLVSPKFNINSLDVPALSFYFFGNYTDALRLNNSQFNIWIRKGNDAFVKIWSSEDHPEFNARAINYKWLKTVINLSEFKSTAPIQLGFQYKAADGQSFGIDKVELYDASEKLFEVSLTASPTDGGELYGEGNFIEGEAVNIEAIPNYLYGFDRWEENEEFINSSEQYSFIMPDNDIDITGVFQNISNIHINEFDQKDNITVFPNPTNGKVSIISKENLNNVEIKILSYDGKLIRIQSDKFLNKNSKLEFDLSSESPGIYIIKINADNYKEIKKINLIN